MTTTCDTDAESTRGDVLVGPTTVSEQAASMAARRTPPSVRAIVVATRAMLLAEENGPDWGPMGHCALCIINSLRLESTRPTCSPSAPLTRVIRLTHRARGNQYGCARFARCKTSRRGEVTAVTRLKRRQNLGITNRPGTAPGPGRGPSAAQDATNAAAQPPQPSPTRHNNSRIPPPVGI